MSYSVIYNTNELFTGEKPTDYFPFKYELDHFQLHGCKINEKLFTSYYDIIILKGILSNIDSYSGFGDAFNNRFEKTALHRYLIKDNIKELVICGLATDYCVQATALDAIRLGFSVTIIHSTIKGVTKETTEKAIQKMADNGVKFYDNVEEYLGKQELLW